MNENLKPEKLESEFKKQDERGDDLQSLRMKLFNKIKEKSGRLGFIQENESVVGFAG